MHEESTHAEVRHEKTDVSTGGVVLFAVWFVVVLAIIHAVLFAYFLRLERGRKAEQPPVPPVAQQRPHFPHDIGQIPAPRLQVRELRDMAELHKQEDVYLQGYRWVDPAKGTVQIPIETTLQMLSDPKTAAAKGLVARAVKEGKR